MFKLIGYTNKDGKTIILLNIKKDARPKFFESAFGVLLLNNSNPLDEVILLDDMRLVIPEAPSNTNFAAVIDANGKIVRRYLKVGD